MSDGYRRLNPSYVLFLIFDQPLQLSPHGRELVLSPYDGVERSETHQECAPRIDGYRRLNPSYVPIL